jgi:hypothetical protein
MRLASATLLVRQHSRTEIKCFEGVDIRAGRPMAMVQHGRFKLPPIRWTGRSQMCILTGDMISSWYSSMACDMTFFTGLDQTRS